MSCPEIESELAAYSRGELGGKEAAVIQKHAAGCAACARKLSALAALASSLPAPAPAPRGFADAVMDRIEREEVEAASTAEPFWRRLPAWPVWATAAACAAALMIFRDPVTRRPESIPAPPPGSIAVYDDIPSYAIMGRCLIPQCSMN